MGDVAGAGEGSRATRVKNEKPLPPPPQKKVASTLRLSENTNWDDSCDAYGPSHDA